MSDESNSVGIIANPQSGKDIRRINAYGFLSNNYEKVNVIQRVLLGLDSVGIRRVYYLPEPFGIVEKACASLNLSLKATPLDLQLQYDSSDSTRAAGLLENRGVRCIVTLGGDGTNRAVAKGARQTPLLPISAGTNNVFPLYIDGTIAGVAAGTFARMDAPPPATVCQRKKIGVWKAGQEVDLALIDVAVCRESFVGARAVVDIAQVKDIVIADVRTEVIGLASIASFLGAPQLGRTQGLHVQLSNQEKPARVIMAPIAPGLVARIPVKAWRKIEVGEPLTVDPEESVIALDGEREIEVTRESRFRIILSQDGPRVIEVGQTLQAAIDRGLCS